MRILLRFKKIGIVSINMSFWKAKKVIVTGGHGFLGNHVVKLLKELDADVFAPASREFDLRQRPACDAVVKDADMVIHLAANVGGIGWNMEKPGELFYDNLIMGVQLIEAARISNVKKFVALGTICAYPKFTHVPFKEEYLWDGYPEETNAAYGLAKKMQYVQSVAYRKQYNFNSIFLLPVNLYGPGDNFDPQRSHVIPALIKKCLEAKNAGLDSVICWGDGSASREFLYVEDAAKAIVLAAEHYDQPEPVNLGSGMEITIRELVEKIKEFTGFEGAIVWDKSKPNGQPRRCLDVSKAAKLFGFRAETPFDIGLKNTIEWYKHKLGAEK